MLFEAPPTDVVCWVTLILSLLARYWKKRGNDAWNNAKGQVHPTRQPKPARARL